jgi:prepilin-type N-terminal cleavage/methylation domain-containing protein
MKKHQKSGRGGFTLVELLTVIAVIAILAGLLLPVLSRSKENGHRIQCLTNQKQLGLAWQMYADDSHGLMVSNDWSYAAGGVTESPSNSWVLGNAVLDTNPATITSGMIYPYVKNIRTYRCPVDLDVVLGSKFPAWRSYSLSCYLGGPPEDVGLGANPLHRINQISKPSATLLFTEEDGSTIDDGHFLYSATVNHWLNIPSWRHQNGDTIAFADGHNEYWKWRGSLPSLLPPLSGVPANTAAAQDLARLQQTAPVPR